MPVPCTRTFRPLGKGWIELNALWRMGDRGDYEEVALFGSTAERQLGFFSFTSDGKRSEGVLMDGTDIHPQAVAFAAQMPAGLARMTYWPSDDGLGFSFAVESRTKKGWSRFLRQTYRRSI